MARWEPGSMDRLRAAALDLFTTRGFEQTTAADIAGAVGLSERTFFRHFADKREVLFEGQDQFVRRFLAGMPADDGRTAPLRLVAAAVLAGTTMFTEERRPYSRLRQTVIDANPALRERERHKLAGLAASVAEALRDRGIADPAATLAAESGVTVFGIAFARWIAGGEERSIDQLVVETFAELAAITATPPVD